MEYTAEAGWQLYAFNDDPAMQLAPEVEAADATELQADAAPATLLAELLAEFQLK